MSRSIRLALGSFALLVCALLLVAVARTPAVRAADEFPEGSCVQSVVGSGTSTAYVVINWDDGVTPETMAWEYQWDGSAQTLANALQAIEDSYSPMRFDYVPDTSGAVDLLDDIYFDVNDDTVDDEAGVDHFSRYAVDNAWSISEGDAFSLNPPGIPIGAEDWSIFFPGGTPPPQEGYGITESISDGKYYLITATLPSGQGGTGEPWPGPGPDSPGCAEGITLQFTAANYADTEGSTGTSSNIVVAQVERTGDSAGAVSVDVQLDTGSTAMGGSAPLVYPEDYDADTFDITISFADGETGTKDVVLPILGDTEYEDPDETINMVLGNAQGGATIGSQDTATFTIEDDDVPVPTVDEVRNNGTLGGIVSFSASMFETKFGGTGSPLSQIRVSSLPAASEGDLLLSGSPVSENDVIAVGDLGNLTFEIATTATDPVVFQWNGTSDGTTYADTTAPVTISVFANTPPTVSDFTVTGASPLTIGNSDFTGGFADPDAGNSLQTVQVLSLPEYGTLALNGTPVAQNDEIPADQLDNLVFTADTDWNGTTTFDWNGSDGQDYATTPATVTLEVTGSNDLPVNTLPAAYTAESGVALSLTGISVTDPDLSGTPNAEIELTLAVDNSATLSLGSTSGLNFTTGDGSSDTTMTFTGTLDAVNAALATLSFNDEGNGPGDYTLTMTSDDQGNTGTGGTQTDQDTATINIPANQPPELSNINKTCLEDTPCTFTLSDFEDAFSDPEEDSLVEISIDSLPDTGTLVLNGVDVAVDDVISAADLGNLQFIPEDNSYQDTSFLWNASDGDLYNASGATVNIMVEPVNDAPSFSKNQVPEEVVDEDSGTHTILQWATGMATGPGDPSGQVLTFLVSNDNPSLFTPEGQPAVNATTGNLFYTLAEDANGVANVTVVLRDDGGTANGGENTSAPESAVITVRAVNDAPSFIGGEDQNVSEVITQQNEATGVGPQTVINWATDIQPGPDTATDEADQELEFILTVTETTDDLAFAEPPAINAQFGTLTYTPQPGTNGVATVSAVLRDNGGTDNGGNDTSEPVVFTITVSQTPALVELQQFVAIWQAEGVEVRWSTNTEIDSWGFHLLRSEDGTVGGATRVTEDLIRATGSSSNGATYSWMDTGIEPGKTYTYWLEEIEMDADVNQYGPSNSVTNIAQQREMYLPMIIR